MSEAFLPLVAGGRFPLVERRTAIRAAAAMQILELIFGPSIKKLIDAASGGLLAIVKRDRSRASAYKTYQILRDIEDKLELLEKRILSEYDKNSHGKDELLTLIVETLGGRSHCTKWTRNWRGFELN